MNSENYTRKLAAILYTDVAGYSRLTGTDELGTHRRLSEYLDHHAQSRGFQFSLEGNCICSSKP